MIRSVTTILTITAIAWHAIVGCCAHHVHADSFCCPVNEVVSEAIHDTCGGHSHELPAAIASHDDDPHTDCPGEEATCSDAKCAYVTSSSSRTATCADVWLNTRTLASDSTLSAFRSLDKFRIHSTSQRLTYGVALRRHLALGILRI
ncbi:MAG: hypothetical protein ACIALR_14760 [Blastopirellula sp. JB062]